MLLHALYRGVVVVTSFQAFWNEQLAAVLHPQLPGGRHSVVFMHPGLVGSLYVVYHMRGVFPPMKLPFPPKVRVRFTTTFPTFLTVMLSGAIIVEQLYIPVVLSIALSVELLEKYDPAPGTGVQAPNLMSPSATLIAVAEDTERFTLPEPVDVGAPVIAGRKLTLSSVSLFRLSIKPPTLVSIATTSSRAKVLLVMSSIVLSTPYNA